MAINNKLGSLLADILPDYNIAEEVVLADTVVVEAAVGIAIVVSFSLCFYNN